MNVNELSMFPLTVNTDTVIKHTKMANSRHIAFSWKKGQRIEGGGGMAASK